ncbi:MAG: DUF192 domain-containing protein [Rhodothermales bacterium]|nr:DUF192 domain-containing protein [Rhodothermales bacterium]
MLSTLILLGTGFGCASGDRPSAGAGSAAADTTGSIPYRVDGSLDFLRDGELLKTIEIEIADTDSARTRGMMQRESIPADWGMLFIFPNEQERGFWMANTPKALDLMFIDADSTIGNIARYVQPMSAETIPSEGPARFVLEVEAGYTESIGILEGDRVRWRRD